MELFSPSESFRIMKDYPSSAPLRKAYGAFLAVCYNPPMFDMNPVAFRATVINIIGNTALFALKLVGGLLSGSIALISDALNSLNDIAASIATFICVRISDKQADEGHPFGHSRAEPIAGLIIAVLAGILGFEVIREAGGGLYEGARAE